MVEFPSLAPKRCGPVPVSGAMSGLQKEPGWSTSRSKVGNRALGREDWPAKASGLVSRSPHPRVTSLPSNFGCRWRGVSTLHDILVTLRVLAAFIRLTRMSRRILRERLVTNTRSSSSPRSREPSLARRESITTCHVDQPTLFRNVLTACATLLLQSRCLCSSRCAASVLLHYVVGIVTAPLDVFVRQRSRSGTASRCDHLLRRPRRDGTAVRTGRTPRRARASYLTLPRCRPPG